MKRKKKKYTPRRATCRECVVCGLRFEATRQDAKCCSPSCRMFLSRAKRGKSYRSKYRNRHKRRRLEMFGML